MVFGPVKTSERVRAGAGGESVRAESSPREVLHQLCHRKGQMIVGFQPRNGKGWGKGLGEVVATDNSDGEFGVGFGKEKKSS